MRLSSESNTNSSPSSRYFQRSVFTPAAEYRSLLGELASIQYEHLDLDDQVDHDLVEAFMNTRIFEYEDVTLKFTDGALEGIAEKAMDRKIGARGLRMILEDMM